jgi:hypothetical protein
MADMKNTTNAGPLSRRSALALIGAGAGAVTSTAALCTLPATATPAVIRPEWASLEAEVVAASDAYYEAMFRAEDADRAFAAWEVANPFPQLGDWTDGDRSAEKAAVATYEAGLGERYERKIAEMRRCRLAATKTS